jgi:hypothetical protein
MACGCHRPPSLWALLSLCCAVVIIPILGCEYSLPLSLCFGDQNVLYILFAAITCSSSSYCTLPAAVDPRHRFRAPAHYPHAGPANLLYFGLAHALGTDSITVSAGDTVYMWAISYSCERPCTLVLSVLGKRPAGNRAWLDRTTLVAAA